MAILACVTGLAAPGASLARGLGIVGQTQAGCSCHSATPTPTVTVSVAGPTALPAGGMASYTVAVSGGPDVGGGFDAAVVDGTGNNAGTILVTDAANTREESGEITNAHPFDRSWTFDWQAPDTPGAYELRAVANSVNGTGSPSGDEWNFATPLTLTVTACAEGSERACGSDVGECHPGVETCAGGSWGPCTGAVGPSPEACDTLDNDCNGVADDRCSGLFCPAGEITLASGLLEVARGRRGDRVSSRRNAFAVPKGVVIDPAHEPVTFYLEGDRRTLYQVDIPAGALAPNRAGTEFAFRRRGSSLALRRAGAQFGMRAKFAASTLASLDPAKPPERVKQLLKVGGRCFSSYLACATKGHGIVCRPERSALLKGTVGKGRRAPLSGVMLTAFDDERLESISVFSQEDGRWVFPALRPGTYRLRTRLIGWEDAVESVTLAPSRVMRRRLTLAPAADTNAQLPATHFLPLLLEKWPDMRTRGDFTRSCGNCHQIGDWHFRQALTREQWQAVLAVMMANLPPFFQDTRDLLPAAVLGTFDPDAPPIPTLTPPPPPSGEVLKAVIYEYGLGDATTRPGCHDLELGLDDVVYADGGVRWIDPRTGERGVFPIDGDAHSIERDPAGNMWITQAGSDRLAKLDVRTGAFRYFPLPKIGDDQGAYPHTLRFDSRGRIWFTLTKSNHLAVFDPATEQFTYHRLPASDPAETGLSIPVAYGCDVAPDDTVWYSQLQGQRIGHFLPATETLTDWRPPFDGPRRLHAGADGVVWVPGFGSGVLGRFDPAIERWKVYDLPTGLAGPPGFGTSELPYSLNVNRLNGEVWITGSNSDTLIRFDPASRRFTAFPLPTRVSYTREIEFDPDNNVWTCTSNAEPAPGEEGRGKFVKVELPPPDAACGNGRRETGEECDDGNADACDACSSRCTVVTGCGDGVVCGSEECDDGNADACDGCSAACRSETGLRCGDGLVNTDCGEECDPPEAGRCTSRCARIARCGDGVLDPGETCDDGNADDCDACTSACTPVTGCGDGVVCGSEACDDGGAASCDGCSATCTVEVGAACGDGIVNAACGEECDPPGTGPPECSWRCRLGPAPPLGTRHLSFGGSLYSSALGTGIPLGPLEGAFDVVAGAPTPDGVASLAVTGPIHVRAAILGGTFGYMCVRIGSCTGIVDCTGGTPVGVDTVKDSAGPGRQDNPTVVTTGLGGDGGPGAVLLTCAQAVVQVPAGGDSDCAAHVYPPDETVAYTTGQGAGHFVNGDARVGSGEIALSGERFGCTSWTAEDGSGKLAGVFLMEADPIVGDTANVSLIDD